MSQTWTTSGQEKREVARRSSRVQVAGIAYGTASRSASARRTASPDHAATARLLEELENTVDVDELELPLLQEGDAPPFLEDGPLLGETARLAGR